jgi:type II secretory pathway component GspD/PulD (secretin)
MVDSMMGKAIRPRAWAHLLRLATALLVMSPAPAGAQEQPGQQDPAARPRVGAFSVNRAQDAAARDQPADDAGEGGAEPEPALVVSLTGEADDPMITFSETAEPMELTALVDMVASTLRINVSVRGELRGSVLFNTTRSVPLSRLLPLLDAMLEQHDFSITFDDASGFYLVQPKANIPVTFGDGVKELASTRLIEIPSIRPSSLSDAVNQVLGGTGTGVSYIDELGLIIITNTPRQIARVESLIARVLERMESMTLTPIELRFISAPAARDRLIALVGGAGGGSSQQAMARQIVRQQQQPGQQQPSIGPGTGGTIENIAERLSVDPQSNALLFRGTGEEFDRVRRLVELIDVPNQLQARRHFVGTAARQLAEFARQRGLGEVIILDDTTAQQQQQAGFARQAQQAGLPFQTEQQTVAGPTLVVDVRNGEIVYYGTEDQQRTLGEMIQTLDTEADRVVIRQYRLQHANAEEVAGVIQALLTGETGLGQNTLLPQSAGQRAQAVQPAQRVMPGGGVDGEIGDFDPARVFVVPDPSNNQIIVKAPLKQQEDFAQLVERLDLRRRQVYIEALIVAVSDTGDFRFALETQFNIGQFSGQTNFGLSEAGDSFTDARNPLSTLGGLTTALIKSEYMPLVINAIQTDTDARILSRPQLLVNDNEEATIASIEQQPTTSQSQGTNSTITSFQGFEDAGTTLTVTPGISEAGFLRLQYEVEFSNFIGTGSDGIPPPRQNQNVSGSVTMPSDATIVVGGITVDNSRKTVVKVPLLGDIPVIGPLFSDTRKQSSNSLLYIFITPKILLDPNFRDLRLITKGPQFDAGIDPELPPLQPIAIDRIRPTRDED